MAVVGVIAGFLQCVSNMNECFVCCLTFFITSRETFQDD